MIWHAKKIMNPPTAEDWNNSDHIVNPKALGELLEPYISSGGGGDSVWTIISTLNFTSATTEFTVSNLSEYSLLKIIFNLRLLSTGTGDNAIYMYPNNDTNPSNYTNVNHVFYPSGHEYATNTPEARMVLCRVGWERETQVTGECMIQMKTGTWRTSKSDFFLINADNYLWSHEIQLGVWKDNSSTISSIRFAVRKNSFTGKIIILGIK